MKTTFSSPIFKGAGLALFAVCLLPAAKVAAQANDNPTGPAGVFNGNITTGCSYDPYTANAMRSVTDIRVSGAVGDYPLAFSRIANTRNSPLNGGFGFAGHWRHSYLWSLTDEPQIYSVSNTPPTSYTVDYPDGRVMTFTAAPNGSPAKNAGETFFRGPRGISERFQPLNVTTGLAYLVMVDGSKVEFKATQYFSGSYYYRRYVAQAVIDPHGLRTTLTYDVNGRLSRITERAGRWLQLYYSSIPNGPFADVVISKVTASDGRSVSYTYGNAFFPPGNKTYNYLRTVSYYADATIGNANYTYKAPNTPDAFGAYNGTPMLASCDDSMYAGPMKKIAYDYVPNASGVVHGQIKNEKRTITTDLVSTVVPGISGNSLTRTETRGDGPSRTLSYSSWPYIGHLLVAYSGFISTNPASQLGCDASNYPNGYIDGNGHFTLMTREPITGRLTSLTHPPDVNGIESSVSYAYSDPLNPYYLASATNELAKKITYTRDSLHRITRTDYPDGAYETFTYNAFNQVLIHRLTSGGTESSIYDARGLKQSFKNADSKTTFYVYDGLDRLSAIQDPRGFQTDFAHNLRGEMIKTTHPADPVTGLRYFLTNAYNLYGSLTSVTDELGHKASYVLDEYQRGTTTTNALGQTTTNSYLPWGKTSSYLTTSNFIFSSTAPSGKKIYNYRDNEFRKTQVTEAPGTTDQAVSYFTCDAVGNQLTAKNPRAYQTTFGYDQRNRLISVARPLSQTTTYAYDQANNKIKETRPDGKFRTWDTFDAMNRVKHTTGFLSDPTSYLYNLAGNLTQMTDSKGAIYSFGYDLMNRKSSATYPVDATGIARSETWSYDGAGNLAQYTNPAGQINTFSYDNRNRQIASNWDASGPDITTSYDAASRVTSVATADGSTVGLGYDNANRQISEDQSLTGKPLRHMVTPVDVGGNRASLSLAGAYTVYYDYTQRQQLAHIRSSPTVGAGQWFGYTYDLNGNTTRRQDLVQGLDSTLFSYDALDRVALCTQTGANDVAFAWSHYQYDLNNDIQDTYRDEEAGKGERFGYDAANQLTSAVYNADNVQTPNPANYDRSVSYTCDALNRTSLNDNGAVTNYTPNGLNQLTNVTGQQSLYDANFNQKKIDGWVYTYDAARRVTNASNNATGQTVQFFYDGLNRCVKRVTGGTTRHLTYDGWKLIAEWNGSGTFIAWNLYGPGPDEILLRYAPAAPTSYLHYHADQFGNVKFILDQDNIGIEKYTYDAFGAPAITSWAGTARSDSRYNNPFMFTGREYLSAIGIYDYRNRMYSPLLGRFLQTDPLGFDAGDNNIYRYVANNPVNASDPTGLFEVEFGGGWGLGGYGHFGYNSGQVSFGGDVGVGAGLFFNLDPHDSGHHDPGLVTNVMATTGAGNLVGGQITLQNSSDTPGPILSSDANLGNVSYGAETDGTRNGTRTTGGTLTVGAGSFAGAGVTTYYNSQSPVLNNIGQGVQNFFNSVLNFFGSIFNNGGSGFTSPGTDVGIAPTGGGSQSMRPAEMPSRHQP